MAEKRINEDNVIQMANMMVTDFTESVVKDEFPESVSAMEIHLAGIVATRQIEKMIAMGIGELPMSLNMYFEAVKNGYEEFIEQCKDEEEEE